MLWQGRGRRFGEEGRSAAQILKYCEILDNISSYDLQQITSRG